MASKLTLRSPFRRFLADERGAFAVMFGVMAIVLVALGGAVVDYITLQQGRDRAQLALDAAALALQPRIFEDDYDADKVQELAQAFLSERIGRADVTADIIATRSDEEAGFLYFEARITVPTIFIALVGVPNLGGTIESEARRQMLELEVMMVLDNSGSMKNESRMTRLVDAAKCATYILMYSDVQNATNNSNTCVPTASAERTDDVRIGIVPFTMFVNVGPTNANATWIDKTGASSIHFDNFDNDDDEDRLVLTSGTHTFPTRQALFAATGEAWRGCVDARPHTKTGSLASEYLDTDDTVPSGGDTLYVPQFSPDMPYNTGSNNYITSSTIISANYLDKITIGSQTNWTNSIRDSPAVCDRPAQGATKCTIVEEQTRTSSSAAWGPAYLKTGTPSGPTDFVNSSLYTNAFYGRQPPSCACRNASSITYGSWTRSGNTQTRTGTCTSFVPLGLSQRELLERSCKYRGAIGTQGFSAGPNADCTRTPILPLTNNPATVISTIGNMVAEGGTNIHEGTVWGFRALTPGAPFTEGGPSTNKALRKVMIIMTDGENTDYNLSDYCNAETRSLNGKCYNSAYGFPFNSQNTSVTSTSGGNINRLGPMNATNATLVAQMNQRTSDTCANAKAAGIEVYTIGLATDKVSQSTTEVVQAMLRGCASTPAKAHFPNQSSELKAVFENIANELSALRLAL